MLATCKSEPPAASLHPSLCRPHGLSTRFRDRCLLCVAQAQASRLVISAHPHPVLPYKSNPPAPLRPPPPTSISSHRTASAPSRQPPTCFASTRPTRLQRWPFAPPPCRLITHLPTGQPVGPPAAICLPPSTAGPPTSQPSVDVLQPLDVDLQPPLFGPPLSTTVLQPGPSHCSPFGLTPSLLCAPTDLTAS